MAKYVRPTWDDYFFEVMNAIAKRASCDRGRSGCVIVKDNQILVTGYVGAPPGFPSCDDVGHDFMTVQHPDGSTSQHCVRTIHAEENAVLQAAKLGIPLEGATLYCRMTPCRRCAYQIIRVGIKEVYCERRYKVERLHNATKDMFAKSNIKFVVKYDDIENY